MAPPILLQYMQVVRRWLWVILTIVAVSVAAGFVVTMLATPKYTAKSRIEISRVMKNVTKVEGLESGESGRDLEFYQTQYAMLEARTIAERVAKSLNLANDNTFFAAHGQEMDSATVALQQGDIGSRSGELGKREDQAVALLLGSLDIAPVRGSALVDVGYESADPILSARIANAWVDQFIQASMDRRFASTADAREFLETRLNELRQRLETAESQLATYASNKDIIALEGVEGTDGKIRSGQTLSEANLTALNTALAQATADRIQAESRASSQSRGASAEAVNNPTITSLREARAEAQAEYSKLMVQFEPGYPAARAIEEKIKSLDSNIQAEERRVRSVRSQELAQAVMREEQLMRSVASLKAALNNERGDMIQYNIFKREADTTRQLYDSLLQRYKEIGVAGVEANNISVVDRAKPPKSPSSPRLIVNLALSLLIGLLMAALATFILEQIDEGIRKPDDVARLLNVPLLGSVPDVASDTPVIEMLDDVKSPAAEAYFSTLSNLAFSTDHGVPRSFMVTSSAPAEGKSTSSAALAMTLARTKRKVLLVDADMRSPSVHQLQNMTNEAGLSTYLAGGDDWLSNVKPTSKPNMSILTAGPTPPSTVELLSGQRMKLLVTEMLEHFDHVILDCPPLLGLADAPLLTQAVEGCVFVVQAGRIPPRGVNSALDRLRSAHARLFGVILTKLSERNAQYGYGYGYSYGYGPSDQIDKTAEG